MDTATVPSGAAGLSGAPDGSGSPAPRLGTPGDRARRAGALALAVGANLAMFATLIAFDFRKHAEQPEPRRLTMVWLPAKPAPTATPLESAPAKPRTRAVGLATRPSKPPDVVATNEVARIESPNLAPPSDPSAPSEAATPADAPRVAADLSTPDMTVSERATRVAIKEAVARARAIDARKALMNTHLMTKEERFAADFAFAQKPDCLKNPMKHDPPVLKILGIPVTFTGVAALPFVAHAVATGKCSVIPK